MSRAKEPAAKAEKAADAGFRDVTITGNSFTGYTIDASATKVAQSIAEAVLGIARSNEECAKALNALSSRFATAEIESMVRIDGNGTGS